MKTHNLLLPLLLLLCMTLGCQKQGNEMPKQPAASVGADVAAIKALVDRWVPLYNGGAFDTLMSVFYAESAVLMAPTGICKGKEAILRIYQKGLQGERRTCR